MKKLIKIIKIFVYIFLGLIIIGGGTLYFFFPTNEIKTAAKKYVKENYNREIDFEDASLVLLGINVNKFRISEEGTFKNGTFAQAGKLVVKLEILPLLSGKVRIQQLLLKEVKVNVIKNEDGKFNFDNFISSGTQTAETENSGSSSSGMAVFAENINLENSSFCYEDKQTKINFDINDLNIGIQKFSLDDLFSFNINLQTSLEMDDIKLDPVIFNLQGRADLENLNLDKVYIDINPLVLAYKEAKMVFKGKMKDLTKPVLNLEGRIEGVDDKIITSVTPMDLPVFALPAADLVIKANADLEKGTAVINRADIVLGNSYIKNEANVDFASENLTYDVKTNLYLSLTDIYKSAKEMLKEIAPEGIISGNIKTVSAKPDPKIKGKISLKNLGAIILAKKLKNFNGEITINSITDVKTNTMSGSYDDSKFVTSLAYTQPSKPININFMLNLDRYTLDDINFDEFFTDSPEAEVKENTPKQARADFGTYNIKTDITVKEVANNVLTAKDLVLKADLKNFANDLSNLQGSLSFNSSDGEIRDINKIMNSSKIMKATFSVIKVIQKVFSVAKLEKISLGKNNKITYSQIEGVYTIKDGLINLDKSTLISNLLTVKASGTINLVSEQLDMKVNTHLGKVTTGSGFKPVVLKIKGTMNDPKYSVDVLSTVTSIANVPVNILKGGVKASTNTASGVKDGLKKGVASTIGKLF